MMKSELFLERQFQREDSIVFRRIGDELFLVPLSGTSGEVRAIYTLTEVAGRIWELLDDPRSGRDIRDRLLQEFDAEEAEVEADLEEFLGHLERVGAIKAV